MRRPGTGSAETIAVPAGRHPLETSADARVDIARFTYVGWCHVNPSYCP
jgi:hypothetical protein